MITISQAEAVLKNYYLDAVVSQLNGEVSPFFNAIEKTSENISGGFVNMSFANGAATGVAALNEQDDLPSARSYAYYGVTLPLKNIYGTLEITDKTLRATADSAGATINVLNAEVEGLVSVAKANFARMLYGDSDGYLCTNIGAQGSTGFQVNSTRNFYKGLKIRVESKPELETEIIKVDTEENIITVNSNVGTVTTFGGEKIFIKGAKGKEIIGLAGIFDGESLYGLSKEEYPHMKAYTKSCKRDDLTEDEIIDVIDYLDESCDSKAKMILCSHKTRRQLATLMSSSRRIVNSTDISAGFSSILINDVPVYADKFCPDDRIYILNTDDFVLCQLCDWSWLEGDGGSILKQIPGKAAYSATLVKYAELVCKKPCGQGLIKLT